MHLRHYVSGGKSPITVGCKSIGPERIHVEQMARPTGSHLQIRVYAAPEPASDSRRLEPASVAHNKIGTVRAACPP